MGDFRRLEAWQKARAVIGRVYAVTSTFPKSEMYGLTGQIRRAAVSVAANIAEGRGKNNDKEFRRYLGIALGSEAELECLLILAADLKLLDGEVASALEKECQEVGALTAVLRRRLGP